MKDASLLTPLLTPLRSLLPSLRRVPFTTLLLVAIIAVAWWTDAQLESLTKDWLDRIGFSAADLWALDLERFATSAVATHGGAVFWRAILAVGLIAGAAEWRTGTTRTFIVFSGSHIVTLIVFALIVRFGLRSWHPALADLMVSARDVGPSAGYFGCLTLLCTTWPLRPRQVAAASIATGLVIALAWSLSATEHAPAEVVAALAHVIAFPVGWLLSGATGPSRPQ